KGGMAPAARLATAKTYGQLGTAYWERGSHDRALPIQEQNIVRLERLVKDLPDVIEYRTELAIAFHQSANSLKAARRLSEAERAYLKSRDLLEALIREQPKAAGPRRLLGICEYNYALLLRMQDRHEEGLSAAQRSVALKESLVADFSTNASYKNSLG